MLFSADARRSSAALPKEKARRKRDFIPFPPSLSFKAVKCLTAGLTVDVSIFAGLGGSEGDMGWDKGEGAIRRLGSGDFDAGEVAAGARRFDEP